MTRPVGVPAEFDVRTIVYLKRGIDPPQLSDDDSLALHHAHLAYLGGLGKQGVIAANGPMTQQSDTELRGMSVYTVDAAEALKLASADPAVQAGRFRIEVARWWVSAGRIAFPEHEGPVGDRIAYEDMDL